MKFSALFIWSPFAKYTMAQFFIAGQWSKKKVYPVVCGRQHPDTLIFAHLLDSKLRKLELQKRKKPMACFSTEKGARCEELQRRERTAKLYELTQCSPGRATVCAGHEKQTGDAPTLFFYTQKLAAPSKEPRKTSSYAGTAKVPPVFLSLVGSLTIHLKCVA